MPRDHRFCEAERAHGPSIHQAGSAQLPKSSHLPEPRDAKEANAAIPLHPEYRRPSPPRLIGIHWRLHRPLLLAGQQMEALRTQRKSSRHQVHWSNSPPLPLPYEDQTHEAETEPRGSNASIIETPKLSFSGTYAPPVVLINDQGDILYLTRRTGKYLEPPVGKANMNIYAMAREGSRTSWESPSAKQRPRRGR